MQNEERKQNLKRKMSENRCCQNKDTESYKCNFAPLREEQNRTVNDVHGLDMAGRILPGRSALVMWKVFRIIVIVRIRALDDRFVNGPMCIPLLVRIEYCTALLAHKLLRVVIHQMPLPCTDRRNRTRPAPIALDARFTQRCQSIQRSARIFFGGPVVSHCDNLRRFTILVDMLPYIFLVVDENLGALWTLDFPEC